MTYDLQDLTPGGHSLTAGSLAVNNTLGTQAVPHCPQCCGYDSVFFDPYEIDVVINGLEDVGVYGVNSCSGEDVNLDVDFTTWGTSNTAIATMTTGQVRGVAAGATTGFADGLVPGPGGGCGCGIPHRVQSTATVAVTPTISGINPAQGLVGTAISVTITGSGFASGATVGAGSNISVSKVSVTSATLIAATFTPTNSSSAGGNQSVTVTAGGQTSNSQKFFNQVPSKLSMANTGSLVLITNGNVVDYFGNILLTGECGGYRDVTSNLLDRETNPAKILGGDFTLTESFSNYSTTVSGLTAPPPESSTQNTAIQPLADTQFFGTKAPSCPGSNDHESFDQSFTITIGSSSYPLSTVYHWERGNYSGTFHVDGSVKTP